MASTASSIGGEVGAEDRLPRLIGEADVPLTREPLRLNGLLICELSSSQYVRKVLGRKVVTDVSAITRWVRDRLTEHVAGMVEDEPNRARVVADGHTA